MQRVLVDTNVVSYFIKRDTRAAQYAQHVDGREVFVCFVTIAELYQWAIRKKWGKKRIDNLLRDIRLYALVSYDDDLAWEWARVTSIPGKPIDPGDAWIAAAALRHGLPLVTHNRRHFEHIPGLSVLSEAP